jgi:hypothetical protein
VEEEMTSAMKRASQIGLGAAIFVAGIAAGSLHARSTAVQNRFGQPKTVLHVVAYKFTDKVSNYDRERAINGIKDMAESVAAKFLLLLIRVTVNALTLRA